MHILHLLLTAMTWGSLFILVKYAMVTFHPYDLTALRFIICACLLAPFLPKALNYAKGKQFKPMMIIACIGSGLPVLCLTIGQSQISSAATGIINALTPISAMVLGTVFFGITLLRSQILGVVLGFTGCLMLVLSRNGTDGENHIFFAMLMVIATLCYGWSANSLRKNLASVPALYITSFTFLINAIAGAIYLFIFSDLSAYAEDEKLVSSSLFLGFLAIAAIISVILYNSLIQSRGALFASMVTYLMPIISVMWGWVDAEQLNMNYAYALGTILLGVFMVTAWPRLASFRQ